MMFEELGMAPPDEEEGAKAWKNAAVTLFSFWGFGSLPVWAYLGVLLFSENPDQNLMFFVSGVSVAITLFMLGAFKAKFTAQEKWRSGLEMMINGSVASLSAFFIGLALNGLAGDNPAAC